MGLPQILFSDRAASQSFQRNHIPLNLLDVHDNNCYFLMTIMIILVHPEHRK